MAPAPRRLAIDLSGGSLRVLAGNMGGPMVCGSAALPDGSVLAGKVARVDAVGQTLKLLLARTEIAESRSLVAVSDSLATFRVLTLPAAATDQAVEAAIAKEFPLDRDRLSIRWTAVPSAATMRIVYAAAWDRAQVKAIGDAVRFAGLEPGVMELKSGALARTVSERSCIVVDLTSSPAEIVLVDGHVPHMWHSFDLSGTPPDELARALAVPLRSVLSFHRRGADIEFDRSSPVLMSAEQTISSQVLSHLAEMIDQPVRLLPPPPRVPQNVRHPTYLACLGLIMRRS